MGCFSGALKAALFAAALSGPVAAQFTDPGTGGGGGPVPLTELPCSYTGESGEAGEGQTVSLTITPAGECENGTPKFTISVTITTGGNPQTTCPHEPIEVCGNGTTSEEFACRGVTWNIGPNGNTWGSVFAGRDCADLNFGNT